MNNEVYEKSIILIGPSGAGKSTIAQSLKEKLFMPRLCLDSVANRLHEDKIIMNKYHDSDEFNQYLILTTLLNVDSPRICDFGAGHSIFNNKEIFESIKKELSPFKNIVLLIPSKEIKYSLEVLNSRSTSRSGKKENYDFLISSCNEELATIIVYTESKTPDEISNEILSLIEDKKNISPHL